MAVYNQPDVWWVETPTVDQKTLVEYKGTAIAVFSGSGVDWHRDTARIFLPGRWGRVEQSCATVALAAIEFYDFGPVDGLPRGWAVDRAVIDSQSNPPWIAIVADLAVKRLITNILRLSVSASVIGMEFQPPDYSAFPPPGP
jgi:hypothetical protein